MTRRWIALGAAALLSACNPQVSNQAAHATASPAPSASAGPVSLNITGRGTAKRPVRIVQQKANRKQYELLARSFASRGAPGSAKVTFAQPHVTFYGKDGSTLIADAARAEIDQSSNVVHLDGNVTAHNSEGMSLKCDALTYDRSTEQFHGTGHVVISERSGFQATGSRVDSDITLTHTQMQ